MAKTNLSRRGTNTQTTHEGAPALPPQSAEKELRMAVAGCLLWEDQHYESGVSIANRIQTLAAASKPEVVADLAVEARSKMNLRHAPLWLANTLLGREDLKGRVSAAAVISSVIQRADEPGEIIAMHWKDGKRPLPAALKRGIASAMQKFDAYQLAKYDRKTTVSLKDVLRLVHPKPKDEEQAEIWKKLIAGELESPDTWEVSLSAGADKKETFERLLSSGKMPYLALIRNLRKMQEVGVSKKLIKEAILARKGARRVLPFRFIAAAKAAPDFEAELDKAFLAEMADRPKLPGKTIIVVDVSGSMYGTKVSHKSDMDRAHAGAALAAIARELCEDVAIYATATTTQKVPPRRGMALVDAVYGLCRPLGGGGIFTKKMCDYVREQEKTADRMIVITDEQDCGGYGDNPLSAEPVGKRAYMINVSSYDRSVAHGKWTSIRGFSENVFAWLLEHEAIANAKEDQKG